MDIDALMELRNGLEKNLEMHDAALCNLAMGAMVDGHYVPAARSDSDVDAMKYLREDIAENLAVYGAVMRQLAIYGFRRSGEARKNARYGVALQEKGR